MSLPYLVRTKLVISGAFLERYDYANPYWVGFPRLVFPGRIKIKLPQKELRSDNVSRTRANLRRLINSNDFNKFVTLTFNTEISDLRQANKYFDTFIKRMRRKYGNFKYICVPEFQKKGRVHYHFLANLPYIENSLLSSIWGNGFVRINEIQHITNIGLYVSKYLGKANFDQRYFNMRKYLTSANLNRPQVINIPEIVLSTLAYFSPDSMQLLFKTSYFLNYIGGVEYKIYKAYDQLKVGMGVVT